MKEIKCIVVNLCYYFSMITLYDYCIKNNKEHLLKEWDYAKNGELKPDMFKPGSGKKVWWKCSICGKSWQAEIRIRTQSNRIACHSCNLSKGRKRVSSNKV